MGKGRPFDIDVAQGSLLLDGTAKELMPARDYRLWAEITNLSVGYGMLFLGNPASLTYSGLWLIGKGANWPINWQNNPWHKAIYAILDSSGGSTCRLGYTDVYLRYL